MQPVLTGEVTKFPKPNLPAWLTLWSLSALPLHSLPFSVSFPSCSSIFINAQVPHKWLQRPQWRVGKRGSKRSGQNTSSCVMRKLLRQRLPKLWVFPQAARTLLCQRKGNTHGHRTLAGWTSGSSAGTGWCQRERGVWCNPGRSRRSLWSPH